MNEKKSSSLIINKAIPPPINVIITKSIQELKKEIPYYDHLLEENELCEE